MCYSQIKIDNPSLKYHYGQPRKVVIPCSDCDDCRRRAQNDWFVRAWFEFQRYNKHGRIFTWSLTYDDAHLPHYVDKRDYVHVEDSSEPYGFRYEKGNVNLSIPCFSMDDLLDFRKRFRIYTGRITKCDPKDIKFLITSEYGDKFHRPHYHVLCFVPWRMSVNDLIKIIEKSWKRGYYGRSKRHGYIVNNSHAIRYVTKYICKDLFFRDVEVQEYLDKDNLDPAEYKFRMDNIRESMPHFRSSENFGIALEHQIASCSDPLEFCLRDKPISIPFGDKKTLHFQIPKYIRQRLFKKKDNYISNLLGRPYFVNSTLGDLYRKRIMLDNYKKDIIEFGLLCDPVYSNEKLYGGNQFYDLRAIYIANQLSRDLQNIDLKQFVFYRSFLRYLPDKWSFRFSDEYFTNCGAIIDDIVNDCYLPPELDDLLIDDRALDDYEMSRSKPISENPWIKKTVMISELPQFKKFENLCCLYDKYNLILSHSRQFNYRAKEKKRRALKNRYREYIVTYNV